MVDDDQAAANINVIITAFQEMELFSGSILVAHGDRILVNRAHGLANRDWNIPNTANTRFNLASLTKAFTATLVLQLVDRKKLNLDLPISQYLPEVRADWANKVTARHLLTHRSGLPRAWQDYSDKEEDYPFKTAEIVAVINELNLDFEPGTSRAYSNTGYFLLSRLVAVVAGGSWEEGLEKGIFAPLKMKNTGIYRFGVPIPNRAHGYENRLVGRPVVGTTGHKDQIYGPQGLFSTTEDLYKFDRGFHGNQLLSDASKDLMFAEGTTESGLGWDVVRGNPFRLALQSGNDGEGFMSLLVRLPDSGHTLVYLTNNAVLGRNHSMDLPNLMISALFEKVPAEVSDPIALNLCNTLFDQGGEAAWSYYQTLAKPEFHKRWVGPRHATGEPDASPGESSRSWTSYGADDPGEWLYLTYARPVRARSVHIYENFNPGAVSRVTVFSGDQRVTLDPAASKRKKGDKGVTVLELALTEAREVDRVLIEFDSPSVKGWNQIDAVGLLDTDDQMTWATDARASSTAADKAEPDLFAVPVRADLAAWSTRYHDLGYYREARLLQDFVATHWPPPLPSPVLE